MRSYLRFLQHQNVTTVSLLRPPLGKLRITDPYV
jgi:hypothetical protein